MIFSSVHLWEPSFKGAFPGTFGNVIGAGAAVRASSTVLRIRCRSSSVYLAADGAEGGASGAGVG